MSRYVGIDPSTKTGLVILGEDGQVIFEREIITVEKKEPHRFMAIANSVLIQLRPTDNILIEGFSYNSRGKGVSTQYGIGWGIRTELIRNGFDYTEVTPGGLKKFASGSGNSSKDALILPLYKKWGYQNDSDNIRDAYVLAQIGRYIDSHAEPTKYQQAVLNALKSG